MASNLRYYPTQEDTVIPWNADYEFPSVANKAIKVSPRIQPTSGAVDVYPGGVIKFTFPAQGFLDCRKTTICFDLYLKGYDGYTDVNGVTYNADHYVYLQNNISSIFKHVKISYGSYDIENIQENGYLQRQLSEFSGYGGDDNDHQSIAKGVGGLSNTRNTRFSTHSLYEDVGATLSNKTRITPCTVVLNGQVYAVKRYQVELPFGLMQQGKLLPSKYMASQLTMEITLAPAAEIILANNNANNFYTVGPPAVVSNVAGTPSYFLKEVYLMPEMLEFDQSYEMRFLKGLESGGVPLQFSTFKHFSTPLIGQNMSIAINERSRSVKAIFSFIRKQSASLRDDWGASYGDFFNNTLVTYQYRVGGRYYPAAPCQNTFISGKRTGGCEPFIELQKAIKTLGDPTIVSAISANRWNIPGVPVGDTIAAGGNFPTDIACADGKMSFTKFDVNGFPTGSAVQGEGDLFTGFLSGVFCMAATLETSNGRELSGLNAEEQSDINLQIKFQTAPPTGYEVVTYTLVDKVMIIRENNYVDINE